MASKSVTLESKKTTKKGKRKFTSDTERAAAKKEAKKRYDNSRIALGVHHDEWERQRLMCGMPNTEFIPHLLSLHKGQCSSFVIRSSCLEALSGSDSGQQQVAYVPETPERKSNTATDITVGTDTGSPEIPPYKQGTSGWGKHVQSSTPVHQDHRSTFQGIIPNDVVEVLTPIKESGPGAARKLAMDVTHSPKLFEELEGTDAAEEQEQEEEELVRGVTDMAHPTDDNCVDGQIVPETNYRKLRVRMTDEEVIAAGKCIAFNDVLEKLLKAAIGEKCKKCQEPLKFAHKKYGTCLVITWHCAGTGRGHSSGTWSSQPRIHNMYAGNILTSTAIALSGNNYTKIALMAKFLNLYLVSENTYYSVQRRYVIDAVHTHWLDMQSGLLRSFIGRRVVMGDARCDSPGHNCQHCTYCLMDMATKKIIAMAVVDCRSTNLNSVIMERLGFQRAMAQVMDKIDVAEVVTDAHPQIRKLMRTDSRYANITHQYDVWHVAKNFAKKLVAAAKEKGMDALLAWIPAVKNHLWFSSRTCDGNADKLRMTWQSVVNHVSNKHTWIDTTGLTPGHCQHEIPLPEDEHAKPWLKPGSPPQQKLYNLVHNKNFNVQLDYLRNFRHTGGLELFHSHLLMYCPKRVPFKFKGYRMRNELAVIDCNEHCDRKVALDKDGNERYDSHWSKFSKRWTAIPVKEPKQYTYIPIIMGAVLKLRAADVGVNRLSDPVPLDKDDPKLIAPNIAPVPKPPMSQLIAEKISRFAPQ